MLFLTFVDSRADIKVEVEIVVPEKFAKSFKEIPKISAENIREGGADYILIKNVSKEDLALSKSFGGWSVEYLDGTGKVIKEGSFSVAADLTRLDHVILIPGGTHKYKMILKDLGGDVAGFRCRLDFGLLVPSYERHHEFSVVCRSLKEQAAE